MRVVQAAPQPKRHLAWQGPERSLWGLLQPLLLEHQGAIWLSAACAVGHPPLGQAASLPGDCSQRRLSETQHLSLKEN